MKRLDDNECWCYGESNYKLSDWGKRVDVDYVAVGISKNKFMKTIVESDISTGGMNWIRERVSESGNKRHLEVAKANAGKIVIVVGGFHFKEPQGKILKILEVV